MPDRHIAADDEKTELPSTDEEEASVAPRHAASLIVLRQMHSGPQMLMGMRGNRHKFMPNRLVFPGGAVDPEDMYTEVASKLRADTRRQLEKSADPILAHGLGVAASRELEEETNLSFGSPAALDGLHFLCRMVTPPPSTYRFNARFLVIDAELVTGTLAGSGELEELRLFDMDEAMGLDLAQPTRQVLQHLQRWLAMSPQQRLERTRTAVYQRRIWGEE